MRGEGRVAGVLLRAGESDEVGGGAARRGQGAPGTVLRALLVVRSTAEILLPAWIIRCTFGANGTPLCMDTNMRDRSGIEWTDSTWNPVTGCTRVSDGCDHCYAQTLAHTRLQETYRRRLPVLDTPANRSDPFAVRLWPERLTQPERWRDSRVIFVNSMSDIFHHQIPDEYVRRIFEVMLRADWHVYQVLTKRPSRAQRFWELNTDLFPAGYIPAHIWMGTSVENQKAAHRVRQIREVPAAIRFLSCEPLIGPVEIDLQDIHWVIVGGESGAEARPMDLEWARGIQRDCHAAAVPFFFKQIGGRLAKSGGRLLDGQEWNEMPPMPREMQLAPI